MKFIADSLIDFCPFCGEKIRWEQRSIEAYYFGVPCGCSCGAKYQYVPGNDIQDLADKYKYGGPNQSLPWY